MKWIKIGMFSFLGGIFFIGLTYFLIGYFKPKPGGILVITSVTADVYIDGSLVGKTPYEGIFKPGTILLKLVPESGDKNLLVYEVKLTLTSGVKTIVRREFGETEDLASGDITTFERDSNKEASLVLISDPDNTQVSIDGVVRGFAPFRSSSISPGEHQIGIKLPGYVDRALTVKTVQGYKLTIFTKLSKLPNEEKIKAESVSLETYVEIRETPTGFLRVRTEPGSSGREIDQVKPNDRFLFLEEDEQSGWYKIQLEAPAPGLPEGRSGWVSDEYTDLVQVTETPE